MSQTTSVSLSEPNVDSDKALLAGVTFRKAGKLHYYRAGDVTGIEVGSRVVAETERGLEFGEVKLLRQVTNDPDFSEDSHLSHPFGIVRLASEADLQTAEERNEQAKHAREICQSKAEQLYLPLHIVDGEATFDGGQVTLYFIAETRLDFRQLVKEVAGEIRARLHLHQVGSRDHAKALGGYGPCGRPLCCTTFLRDFAPVSMKMAKDQSLYLNPSKFSGVCGKLMCCLRYEHEVYLEAVERLPQPGSTVSIGTGERGIVTSVDIFRETVTVQIRSDEDTRFLTIPASNVNIARACGDCGEVGGGCGSSCASGCNTPAKVTPPIMLERWPTKRT